MCNVYIWIHARICAEYAPYLQKDLMYEEIYHIFIKSVHSNGNTWTAMQAES